MAFYQLNQTQKIPDSIVGVWDFISSPVNLQEITPSYMGFIITSKNANEKMYAGMIISYKVRPLAGINLNWVTEITQLKDKEYFVDEQRIGPYKMWHHQHRIEAIEGGVLMTDIVSYQPPMGILGALANALFIKQKLKSIFNYRTIALEKRFGKF
ncbi:MAG: SRPBCC family protein [Bacteroidetes bacterium]|nr:SRPBCC family protein [Bacteroidota bacterium]